MPIRILHVVTYMGRGGLETMLMNYYRHIDRDKVQFDFLVHRDFEADYDQEIKELGGRIYHISRLIPWSSNYKKELKQFFMSHPEYKIVHVHQDCLSSVALKCAKECGIPVRIAHSHNSNQDKNIKYLIKKHYMKQIPEYATHLFACGKTAGDWMFSGHSYTILNNAIDFNGYLFNEDKSIYYKNKFGWSDYFVIGHVGNFRKQKNHTFLIDIFSQIVKIEPKSKLVLIGDGDEFNTIKEKVSKLSLSNDVVFVGNSSSVNEYLQAMDVFVFPSLYEGLSLSILEAQASGLPCVMSTNVPSDCIVTEGLVTSVSLDDSPETWARIILEQKKIKRTDHSEEIIKSGYEITTAAKQLQAFYLKKSEEV